MSLETLALGKASEAQTQVVTFAYLVGNASNIR